MGNGQSRTILDLSEYIEENKKKGFSIELIKQKALAAGYKKEDINQAIEIGPKRRNSRYFIITAISLICVIFIIFLFINGNKNTSENIPPDLKVMDFKLSNEIVNGSDFSLEATFKNVGGRDRNENVSVAFYIIRLVDGKDVWDNSNRIGFIWKEEEINNLDKDEERRLVMNFSPLNEWSKQLPLGEYMVGVHLDVQCSEFKECYSRVNESNESNNIANIQITVK